MEIGDTLIWNGQEWTITEVIAYQTKEDQEAQRENSRIHMKDGLFGCVLPNGKIYECRDGGGRITKVFEHEIEKKLPKVPSYVPQTNCHKCGSPYHATCEGGGVNAMGLIWHGTD